MMLGGGRRRRSMWGWGGGWGWGRRRHVVHHHHGGGLGGGGGGGGCGCFTMILGVFILIIALAILGQVMNWGAGGNWFTRVEVPASTVERTALSANAANTPSPRFIDNLGWINNSTRLLNGFSNFHRETGVMPFLYITDNLDGNRAPNMQAMSNYAARLFDRGIAEWGFNEANLLLLVFEYGAGYGHYIIAGNQAGTATLIDSQAIDIIDAYIRYYWYADIDACELFARAFTNAGNRIMRVHRSPWIPVMIVAGVLLILFLLFTWWKAKRDQKNLEAEQTERILGQDLNEFGTEQDDEASRLAQQYEEDDDNSN